MIDVGWRAKRVYVATCSAHGHEKTEKKRKVRTALQNGWKDRERIYWGRRRRWTRGRERMLEWGVCSRIEGERIGAKGHTLRSNMTLMGTVML